MKKASSAEVGPTQSAGHLLDDQHLAKSGRSLWLWVAAGFVFLGLLWTAMFTASRLADTRSVPLATQGGRP
jgi:hypothetical protein